MIEFFRVHYLEAKFPPSSVQDVQALIKVNQHMVLRVADVKLLITHFCPAAKNTQMVQLDVCVGLHHRRDKRHDEDNCDMCSETTGAAGEACGTTRDVKVLF